jgi:hypothetical protein
MAFAAAAIPIAVSLLGAMSKKEEQPQQQMGPRPPSLGELAHMNSQPYMGQSNFALPDVGTFQAGPIGGGQRGNNG